MGMRLAGPALVVGTLLLHALAVLSPATASEAEAVELDDRQQQQEQEQRQERLPGTRHSDSVATTRALGAASETHQAGGGGATVQQQQQQQQEAYFPARVGGAASAGVPMRRAYATLLYSDFIEGTRALGQSLRDSGTTADTVVLVTPDVRQETRERLAQDGWM